MGLSILKNRNVAIDLGNNNTVVTDRERILLAQPSYIVFDAGSHAVRAIGEEAFRMYEKSPDRLRTIKPLRGGVIADYDSASRMISEMLTEACARSSFLSGYNNIISGIPYNTTEVERRALRDALGQFDSRNTFMIYEPLAAGLGMGLDIRAPEGKMLIDIGGGITEIVVISLSGIATFQSLKVAGDTFDQVIQDYFRRQFNMAIGLKSAEQVKIQVGAVYPDIEDAPLSMIVKGKDLMEGIPVVREIDHHEVCFILEKSIASIERGIVQTLETCPPELAADIYHGGIHVTGGSAMLRGLRERWEKSIGLPVHIDTQPLYSVGKGVAHTLSDPTKFRSILFQ
jgi:rod shape-determining protein MreB